MKAAYFMAANQAVSQTEFVWTYRYFTGLAAWLIIALVMRKSFFGKWIGGLGVIVSALFVVDMASVYAVPAIAGNFILPFQLAFVAFPVHVQHELSVATQTVWIGLSHRRRPCSPLVQVHAIFLRQYVVG
jgi:hypothetical protein